LATASSDSETSSHSKQLNVLTRDQEFILEAIKRLDDPQLQKSYLDKLLNNFNKPRTLKPVQNHSILPTTSTNTYDLTKMLNKKKKSKPKHYCKLEEGVVPKRFLQNTSETLSAANNSKLHLLGKTQASILNNGFYLKNFFVVTNHTIILGTPFIDIITLYKAKHDCIISKINGMRLVFPVF
jgi:hypothetical protein